MPPERPRLRPGRARPPRRPRICLRVHPRTRPSRRLRRSARPRSPSTARAVDRSAACRPPSPAPSPRTRAGRNSRMRSPRAALAAPLAAGAAAAADPQREFAFSRTDFEFLVQLAYEHAGISLSEGKRNLVYGRLSRRLRALGLTSFAEYRAHLGADAAEIERFINSISTNHTKFFREAHHFTHLASVAQSFARGDHKHGGRRLRIWSAGCSTGEEPYTI